MNILIVEDNPRHQKAAVDQLKNDHNVYVVEDWPSARKAIEDFKPEVVFSDLKLPSTNETLSDGAIKKYPQGTLVELGFSIILYASQYPFVKYMAILTDGDHHDDPITASIDYVGRELHVYFKDPNSYLRISKNKPKPTLEINGKRVIVSFAPMLGEYGTESYVKDWGKVLGFLMNDFLVSNHLT